MAKISRLLTSAIVALAIVLSGHSDVAADGEAPSNINRLEGCYFLTCGQRSFYVLEPEVVTIGGMPYLKGVEAGVANGVRDTDFSGQQIFISLPTVSVLQKVPTSTDSEVDQ